MPAKVLMFQGTGSGVGKSLLTTALCRILCRQGIRTAPFKAVNMSNNASVTRDGGEIATAQAVQAKACGIEPTVQMNPVLLKPTADHSSQVVVLGRPIGVVSAADFRSLREKLLEAIEDSLKGLIDSYEFVLIEGAGSPAEINLQETDLANMAVAREAQAPVILVADIDRGGVFASLIGTLELLKAQDRERVEGFIINKFRGDAALLQSGLDWLENRTGRPVLGVIPFLQDVRIPEEDSFGVRHRSNFSKVDSVSDTGSIRICVVCYPTISNFTDFDPLRGESDVSLEYLTRPPSDGDRPDLLILPGSKSTVSDLIWLRRVGFDRYLIGCLQRGVEILGICGGFQMLGGMIYDPNHVESEVAAIPGLGLLPTDTLFLPSKVTAQVRGIHLESGEPVTGYEIHAGRLQRLRLEEAAPRPSGQGSKRGRPVFKILERGGSFVEEWDGCQLPHKKIWGSYLHGLFESDRFRHWFLGRLRPGRQPDSRSSMDPYDALADAVGPHLSFEKIMEISSWPLPV